MTRVSFVVLSSARSGTSHLGSTLKKTDRVFFHGEIFHKKVFAHVREEYWTARDVSLRDRDPVAFARDVHSFYPPGTTRVGFKMWRGQSPAACDALLRDESVHKIVLERKNRLAAYSSVLKARLTGVWNRAEGQERREAYREALITDFDPETFRAYVARQDHMFRLYKTLARGPMLNLTYDDILRDTAYGACLEFLGLTPPGRRPPGKEKLNPTDILGRFAPEKREDVKAAAELAGHPEWLSET